MSTQLRLLDLRTMRALYAGVIALAIANLLNQAVGTPFWTITRLIDLGSDGNAAAWYSSVLLLAGAYVVWLDIQVTSQFTGKRWSLPARVYARPLELYAGSELTPQLFAEELRALNYRPVSSVQQVADRAFFRKGRTWVDSRLVDKASGQVKEIRFGSKAFWELVEKLARQGRQASISLHGDILLLVDGQTLLIRNR